MGCRGLPPFARATPYNTRGLKRFLSRRFFFVVEACARARLTHSFIIADSYRKVYAAHESLRPQRKEGTRGPLGASGRPQRKEHGGHWGRVEDRKARNTGATGVSGRPQRKEHGPLGRVEDRKGRETRATGANGRPQRKGTRGSLGASGRPQRKEHGGHWGE